MIITNFTVCLILLTLILIVLFIMGLATGTREWLDVSANCFIALLAVMLLGWGLLGNVHFCYTFSRDVQAKVIKTENSIIFIQDGLPVYTSQTISDWNKYTNNTVITIKQKGGVNMYGSTNWMRDFQIP